MPFARVHHPFAILHSAIRRQLIQLTGVRLGSHVVIGAACELAIGRSRSRRGTLTIGPGSRLERGVVIHPYGGAITLGRDVFLGPYVVIYGHGGVEIGDDSLIAMHCRILSSNHEIPPIGVAIRSRPDRLAPTRIGSDVWLGAGVTVLAGVTIGDGCVVAAGAVVTRDLPAGTVAQGVPARPVRTREP